VSEDRVFTQDITAELIRDWLDEACIDAAIDETGDVFVVLDGTRMIVRVNQPTGAILVWASIRCDGETDRADMLEAINDINADAMFIRAVLFDCADGRCVHYEHEHWGTDGVVGRRQLVKLVRYVRVQARAAHRTVMEAVS
jgi:hypothetical protein